MRLLRNAVLICATTLAAMAFAATSVSAQVEVSEEPSGDHCSVFGCITALQSSFPMNLDVHIFGIEFTDSQCHLHAQLEINEDGSGTAQFPWLTGAGCNRDDCFATPWSFSITEDFAGRESMELTFCVEPVGGGDPINCSINLAIDEFTTHDYDLAAEDEPCHGDGQSPAEISADLYIVWDGIEISH